VLKVSAKDHFYQVIPTVSNCFSNKQIVNPFLARVGIEYALANAMKLSKQY